MWTHNDPDALRWTCMALWQACMPHTDLCAHQPVTSSASKDMGPLVCCSQVHITPPHPSPMCDASISGHRLTSARSRLSHSFGTLPLPLQLCPHAGHTVVQSVDPPEEPIQDGSPFQAASQAPQTSPLLLAPPGFLRTLRERHQTRLWRSASQVSRFAHSLTLFGSGSYSLFGPLLYLHDLVSDWSVFFSMTTCI